MGFFTTETAYYQIRYQHRHQEVLEVLRLGVKRKICNATKIELTKKERAKDFTRKLKKLLQEGIALWQQYKKKEISLLTYRRLGNKLQKAINYHLRDRSLTDVDNQRFLDSIGMQETRGRVTLFLRHPEIEPTNNRAERGLRPAVIARKVSHCSKNERGARTYSVMKSIFVTLSYRTKSVLKAFSHLLKGDSLTQACEH
jgi:transposase